VSRAWLIALLIVLAGAGAWILGSRAKGPAQQGSGESPLFSGKEPKLKIQLSFPSSSRPGFNAEAAEIYQTASKSAQLKQALQLLFAGPKMPGSLAVVPPGFKYRELFLADPGLAVLDLDADSVAALPGGTSSEFALAYCLAKALLGNFKDVQRLRILVGGKSVDSLAGHFDVSSNLALEDF
jgi:hypothetical protein